MSAAITCTFLQKCVENWKIRRKQGDVRRAKGDNCFVYIPETNDRGAASGMEESMSNPTGILFSGKSWKWWLCSRILLQCFVPDFQSYAIFYWLGIWSVIMSTDVLPIAYLQTFVVGIFRCTIIRSFFYFWQQKYALKGP